MKYTLYIFVCILALAPYTVSAQALPTDVQSLLTQTTSTFDLESLKSNFDFSNTGYGVEEPIQIDMDPTYPRPGQDVVLKIDSNTMNLNKARITWRENSTIRLQQIGATSFTFQMGQLSETKTITVEIEKPDRTLLTKTYLFKPSEIDMLYEATTYVPPFYRGRALPSHQSEVRVVAIPNMLDDFDRLIPAGNYTYKWSLNGRVVEDQSGYGKNIFTYSNTLLAENTRITVNVEPQEYAETTEASIVINPIDPLVVMYEKNPIYGTIFEQAVTGTYQLNKKEITLEAAPVFFTPQDLSFYWFMNNEQIEGQLRPNEITFRVEGTETGKTDVGVRVNNDTSLLQSASVSFTLLFDNIIESVDNMFTETI